MAAITRLALIKFFELVLVCILLALHVYSDDLQLEQYIRFLTEATIGGYIIILVGLFAGGLMGTPVNRRVDLFYSLIGCALFIVIGALNIHVFNNMWGRTRSIRDTGLSKGSLAIFEGALFLMDAILTFRGEA